jgi:predicted amidophosphoribosyltransferase
MNENVKITPDDYKDIRHISWNGPVQISDVETLINTGEMCPRYLPCPICRKCGNKASHLFEKCSLCGIPLCIHTDKQKNLMIKRKNFTLLIPKEAMEALDSMAEDVRNQRTYAI